LRLRTRRGRLRLLRDGALAALLLAIAWAWVGAWGLAPALALAVAGRGSRPGEIRLQPAASPSGTVCGAAGLRRVWLGHWRTAWTTGEALSWRRCRREVFRDELEPAHWSALRRWLLAELTAPSAA